MIRNILRLPKNKKKPAYEWTFKTLNASNT